jgi:hypothetical protein
MIKFSVCNIKVTGTVNGQIIKVSLCNTKVTEIVKGQMIKCNTFVI